MATNPQRMQFNQSLKSNFVESFSFRGHSADSRYAFVIEHRLHQTAQDVVLTLSLACFDKQLTKTYTIHEQQLLSSSQLEAFLAQKTWQQCVFSLQSGSFFEIGHDVLRGKLHSHAGSFSWHLRLQRHHQTWQLNNRLWYLVPFWPRHKLQLADINIKYLGKINSSHVDWAGDFKGSSCHYWGYGYPNEYAVALTHQFNSNREGFFCGFSQRPAAKIAFNLPYCSLATLKIGQKTYHFQELTQCLRHQVTALDDYHWHIRYQNADYMLEVEIEGANPRLTPWVSWQDMSSNVIKASSFAQGKFTLYHRQSLQVEECLHSQQVFLQSRLPENTASSDEGFWLNP